MFLKVVDGAKISSLVSLFKSLYDSLFSSFESYQRNSNTSPEECFCDGEVNGSQSVGLQAKLMLVINCFTKGSFPLRSVRE